MSKKKKVNNQEIREIEVEEREETEMEEKKGLIARGKEAIHNAPKPVKVIGGVLLGIGAVAAAGFAAVKVLNSGSNYAEVDSDVDVCDEADNIEIEDLDVTDTEE